MISTWPVVSAFSRGIIVDWIRCLVTERRRLLCQELALPFRRSPFLSRGIMADRIRGIITERRRLLCQELALPIRRGPLMRSDSVRLADGICKNFPLY